MSDLPLNLHLPHFAEEFVIFSLEKIPLQGTINEFQLILSLVGIKAPAEHDGILVNQE